MPRPRTPRSTRLSPDIESLIRLARSLALSSSRIEDNFWDIKLASAIDRLLASGNDEGLNAALDNLNQTDQRACDALADMIECRCESLEDGNSRDVLLFAAPLMVWSRYAIPSGPISADILANLRVHLAAHVLASDVRIGLADVLFSPDQLPQSYSDTSRLKDKLFKAAVHGRDLHLDPKQLRETANFLSDTRYLVGALVAERGAPLFRWQEDDGDRESALARWRTQGGEAIRPLLPACANELLLPMAFHSACREADRQSRPYSIRASVAFLHTAVNIDADQLIGVVALFREDRAEEYRIGFVHKQSRSVVHGVVWPLLDAEDGTDSPIQIDALLKECGIKEVRLIDHAFPLEYCDDCGVPLYPNLEDEAVHAELPEEDGTSQPQHLH